MNIYHRTINAGQDKDITFTQYRSFKHLPLSACKKRAYRTFIINCIYLSDSSIELLLIISRQCSLVQQRKKYIVYLVEIYLYLIHSPVKQLLSFALAFLNIFNCQMFVLLMFSKFYYKKRTLKKDCLHN